MARDPALNTVTTLASIGLQPVSVPAPQDSLSMPSNDDLVSAAISLWPQGAAWGSPDGQAVSLNSNLARFTRVLIDSFEWLYARAFQLWREATVSGGVFDLLPEWEAEYGLPDTCIEGPSTRSERLRALEAKVLSQATVTPGDIIRIASSYGFSISIEEPAMFECGFSECGGEHTLGDIRQESFWIARVFDLAIDYFRVGESELSVDPLFDIGDGERLLCILNRISPAWTTPVLSFFAYLIDGQGNRLTDGDGRYLISGAI
ncbi:DUF2313 domain-containing protein [Ensifer adhaerens]|uniref:putative phage tail protein n=1 Tax=Ensifer adhaerens TaxID=106592 RepID=UPI001CBBA3A0|nr:putative phage tail protein [Ensifer adhaerens]MBZ7923100.1 DUF2313 domain-containing protein [Ensifer adhaerens]UAX91690.1 DUF2313 domain-containing protein [Ensifer adhaerens]UAX99318.1 DUF2313 domain-containing protein [Ensifer adhaerens]UAY06701.1 DUF2313 domain-containing protein [Ensifer adhaerens]